MLLKSLPLVAALLGFAWSGSPANSADIPDAPVVFHIADPDCACFWELTRNVVTAAPFCPQETGNGIILVPCFYTEYVMQNNGEYGECPEKTGCTTKVCSFPSIQVMINWQFESVVYNDGCYGADECCESGVGYAGSTQLDIPNDVMEGAGSYVYMPWRRDLTADCGTQTLADWSGLKCDGRSENDPWTYYEEFWYKCKQCPLAGN